MNYKDEVQAAIQHAEALVEFFSQWEHPMYGEITPHPDQVLAQQLVNKLYTELRGIENRLIVDGVASFRGREGGLI